MSRNISANTAQHKTLLGILAMVPTIEDQQRAFARWLQESPQLPKRLVDILDIIKTHGEYLKSALMSLQPVYDDLSRERRNSDAIIADLEERHSMNFSKEVIGVKGVLVALNAAGPKLQPPSNWAKRLRASHKEATATFEKLCGELDGHLRLIRMMTRALRHASHPPEPEAFPKEYAELERKHWKEVLDRLWPRFREEPFAVTVPLDPEREQSKEEGRDHADMIYQCLDQEKAVETFLQQFKDMGSKWAAAMLGGSPTPDMRTLEMAHTRLSCGVMNALQQSIPRDEGVCRLQDDTDFLHCRLARWEELTSRQKVIIAIGGHFSHGKSSFLNALIGDDVLPTNSESNEHDETEANTKHPRVIHDRNTLPHSTQS